MEEHENREPDPKLVIDTLEFVEETGRFNFVRLIEYGINRLKNAIQRERERKRWRGSIFNR